MDIYEALERDHLQIKDLLRELEAANDHEADDEDRAALLRQLRALVTAHSETEEEVFYQRLRKDETTSAAAREGAVEHGLVSSLLETLEEMRVANPDWSPHCKVVKELLEHHIREEESELFPRAREILDDEEARRLGERMEERRDERLDQEAV